MEDKIVDEIKDRFNNLIAPIEFRSRLIAFSKVNDDYDGFFREIIDDLEAFYDVSKYPAVEIAISLLRDYQDSSCHYPSKKTLKFLKSWRKQK